MRLESNGGFGVLDGLFQMALVVEKAAEIDISLGEVRDQGDGPAETVGSFRQFLGTPQNHTQVVMGPAVVGLQGQSSAVALHRLLQPSQAIQATGQGKLGGEGRRLQSHGLLQHRYGLGAAPQGLISNTQVGQIGRLGPAQRQGLLDMLHRLGCLAALLGDHPQKMPGIRVLGVRRQHRAVTPLGFLKPTRPVRRKGG